MLKRETSKKEQEIIDENIKEKIEEYVEKNYKKLVYFTENDGDEINFTKEVYDIIKILLPKEKDQEEYFYHFVDYFQKLLFEKDKKLTVPGSVTTDSIREIKEKSNNAICGDFDIRDLIFTWKTFCYKWQSEKISADGKEMLYDLGRVFRYSNDGKVLYITKRGSSITPIKITAEEPQFYCYVDQGDKQPKKMTLKSLCQTIYRRTPIVTGHIDFNPQLPIDDTEIFNLWRGFKAKKLARYDIKKIRKILNHIKMLVQTDEWYHWVLSWFSWIIKHPHIKTEKCLIFAGPQGIGKDFLGKLFAEYIIGYQNSVTLAGLDKLFQRFNSIVEGRILINAQELLVDKKTQRSVFEILKSIITEKYQTVEKKGIDVSIVIDCSNIFCSSNHKYECMYVEEDDRRFAIPELPGEEDVPDQEYFDELFSCCNQETADHFFTYLLQYDGLDVRNRHNMPFSHVKEINKQFSGGSSIEFVNFLINEKVEWEQFNFIPSEIKMDGKRFFISKQDFYRFYESWCDKYGHDACKHRNWFWRSIHGKIKSWKKLPKDRFNRLMLPKHIDPPRRNVIDI